MKIWLPGSRFEKSKADEPDMLVCSGATARPLSGLHFARLSGCRISTTCTPRDLQLVRELSVHEVFDYPDGEACVVFIRTAINSNLF